MQTETPHHRPPLITAVGMITAFIVAAVIEAATGNSALSVYVLAPMAILSFTGGYITHRIQNRKV